jgi:hypothetical protein
VLVNIGYPLLRSLSLTKKGNDMNSVKVFLNNRKQRKEKEIYLFKNEIQLLNKYVQTSTAATTREFV